MTSIRPPFGLHIGLPRTGTKTLQWQLLSRHPQVHYMGLWHRPPRVLRSRKPRKYRSAAASDLFDAQLIEPGMDLQEARALWQELQTEADPEKVIVWSKETLSWGPLSHRRIRAERLWRILRPCRVILTLREPTQHIESVYKMILRGKQIAPTGDPRLQSIDAWFEDSQAEPFAKIFDHHETVRTYRRLFGSQSVKVMLFEKLEEDPRGFFEDVCEHFGIDPQVGADLYADRVDNARITDRQVRLAAWLQGNPRLRSVVNRLRPGFRAELLFRLPSKTSASSDLLSAANADRIRELSRAGNRWFQEELGLEIEKHGYAV